MGQSGDHRCRAISRHLKVLLPPSSSSSHKLRISDDFARHMDGAGETTAFVMSPLGSKVWRVEVGRDGGGAYLSRGWPEFVAAHGIRALWFVVFRHHGRGVLTVKAFDTSFCLSELLSRPKPVDGAGNGRETAAGSRRPQFIRVLLRRFKDKMVIPPAFIRKHITKAEMNSGLAVLSLCGEHQHVEVEKDRSGNVWFSGGWSRFLASNGITQGEALLLRYEGKMEFTVKVFGFDGCQKIFKSTKISDLEQIGQSVPMKMREEDDAPSSSTGKRKSSNEVPSSPETKPASSSTPSKKKTAAEAGRNFCTYDMGPPSWIRKRINTYVLKKHLPLPPTFCKAIGFSKPCEITLRTSTGNGATRSWQVHGCAYSWSHHHQLGKGWKSFCRHNRLREGDVCTFNIIESTLWHVEIARCSQAMHVFDVA
ncbi:hypothetical protein PR202_ga31526 [Eleusine coracana subsp. coracana]|uniref:TF-B3 domain-containing protein n=1 Tax=Eleusine coracana subsp. coracana TaxID=191504 RepID=A0AAV5DST6_ELECO|nr:hypothetical protein PR202_ga31526 [Eleusine coracana subsp. coracana]